MCCAPNEQTEKVAAIGVGDYSLKTALKRDYSEENDRRQKFVNIKLVNFKM